MTDESYKEAGVDIEAGDKVVELIKDLVRSTSRPEVVTDIGGFGGLFSLKKDAYEEPVLVSSTDGVGTKLKIAQVVDRHNTVGIDLVAMCVNDIVVQGAEPLFFLDYLATGKLVPQKVVNIVKGIAEGCKQAGCALIGGETAEMPGFYSEEKYDLAGFVVGVVEKVKIIDGSKIESGDVILGLASSGLHSNGYSLVRKIFLDQEKISLNEEISKLGCSLGEELLRPTKIYVKSILELTKLSTVHGLANITGGGFQNIARILPQNLDAVINKPSWERPAIFNLIRNKGNIAEEEMYQVFNMGIGMVVVLPESELNQAVDVLIEADNQVYQIGKIKSGNQKVKLV